MTRILLALLVLSTAFVTSTTEAATATCSGKVQKANLYFQAKGSLLRKRDGTGLVRINGRVVAQFDGDAARINYLSRSFSIRNDRGDIVEGKLNNIRTGASTLTKMILPGEGVRVFNVGVICSMD